MDWQQRVTIHGRTIRLTDHHARLLLLIGAGMSNQEIADELHLSVRTVKNYVVELYDICGAHSRVQIALLAHGIDVLPD